MSDLNDTPAPFAKAENPEPDEEIVTTGESESLPKPIPVTTPVSTQRSPADSAAQTTAIENAPTSSEEPLAAPSSQQGTSVGGIIGIAIVVSLIVGSFVGGAAGFAGSRLAERIGGGGPITTPTSIEVIPAETDEPIVAAVAASLSSVVNIDVSGAPVTDASGALPEGHPGVPVSGNGSGLAWQNTEEGGTLIITNAHVVKDVSTIVVTGTDRERHYGTLLGADAETDIAVIEIDAMLPVIDIGDSDTLLVGQMVVAIGSPYGLSQSVSSGVVSAIGRSLPNSISDQSGVYPLVDVIQTDAAINPGNSGGALVDRYGKLIGINTAIYSESGSSGGIGFAVPVNTAIRIAQDLVEHGSAQHPFLGILGRDVDSLLAEEENLPVNEGAFIVDVTEGTKAEEADLRAGDVIVMLDEDEIRSMDDLILEVRRRAIGDTVIVTLYRDGERIEIEMGVGIKPTDLDLSTAEPDSVIPETETPEE